MRKLLIAVAVVIVVVLAAVLIAPFLIPTDTYASRIEAAVKSATGRELTIAGPVKLSFLPRLELEAADVSLANAPGAHEPQMLHLKKLEVTLRLLPLLVGNVELGRFVLTEPQIALEIDKAGRPNWVFSQPQSAAAAPGKSGGATTPAASGGTPVSLSGLSLGDVRLINGKLTYRDDRSGTLETVEAIDMTLSLPDLDHPFAGEGSAVWHGQKLALSLGVAKPRALLDGGASDVGVHLVGAPLDLGFTGSLTGLPPTKVGGTVDLKVPSVRGLASWAGTKLPPGPGLQKLAIKGRIDKSGSKLAFTNAAIALDAITAKGSLAVTTGGVRPVLNGTLAIDRLDVNPYLPASAPQPSPSAAPAKRAPEAHAAAKPASEGWSDAPIDLSGLHRIDGDFDLQANAILYRKIEIGPSALALHLKDGKLTANLTRLSLYQGSGKGTLSVDGSGATPQMAMDFALRGVAVGPLLAASAGTDRLEGTGNIDFAVAGSGKSQRALVSALNGKGAFNLANGKLKGANLIALAENSASPLTGAKSENATSFGSLTGTFTIKNGVLKNDDLQLKSGVIPITGAGTVSLPARRLDYRLTVSLAGAIGVPVKVTGPWDDISYRPDLAGALKGVVKTPGNVLDQLRGLGGQSGSSPNPADLLKGLLGK